MVVETVAIYSRAIRWAKNCQAAGGWNQAWLGVQMAEWNGGIFSCGVDRIIEELPPRATVNVDILAVRCCVWMSALVK